MGNSDDRNLSDSPQMTLLGKIMMFGILGLFFIIIIFVFLQLYNKFFWLRRSDHSNAVTVRRRRRAPTDFAPTQHHQSANRIGLDPSTLKTIPIVTYNPEDFKDGIECVVCLSDVAAGEKIRLLETCKHGFHVDCIDMWLQSHSTCPVCRYPLSSISKPINDEQIIESDQESIQELPTNVLFWGDESEVRNSSLLNQESGDGTVAIDVVGSSSGENDERTKPSVIMSRLRSFRRLLSGERVNPCSSSSSGSSGSNVVGEEHV